MFQKSRNALPGKITLAKISAFGFDRVATNRCKGHRRKLPVPALRIEAFQVFTARSATYSAQSALVRLMIHGLLSDRRANTQPHAEMDSE
ncbi:hypothetical protein AW938_15590 [Pseudomonas aeruginosa]|nr:hypothetical protein AW937_14880 [Pseudomonas aeruginosa]KXF15227.1 hypothetical protein AW938_15590 [Pseudomonas aeruginosa]KXF33023.1 hypothetical protein AW939_15045 [Pseudomonas aeruginosa]